MSNAREQIGQTACSSPPAQHTYYPSLSIFLIAFPHLVIACPRLFMVFPRLVHGLSTGMSFSRACSLFEAGGHADCRYLELAVENCRRLCGQTFAKSAERSVFKDGMVS